MHSLMVIIDGLGDDPIAQWDGRTPFDHATHPNIDKLLLNGKRSDISICEDDFLPESLGCILRLLGVRQEQFPANRAYLELLANHRDVSEYEMVLRCNLVSLDEEDTLISFNAQGLSSVEKQEAATICNEFWQGVEFLHLSMYRNLLILDKDRNVLDNCIIPPPHESMGKNIKELLADVRSKSLLLKMFIDGAAKRLEKFNRNGIRYMLYPWGASERKELPEFEQLHQIKGAVVCEAEIVRGIARALKMDSPRILEATADIDTNIQAKTQKTLELLQKYDFVLTHFNGADEAAHRYDYQNKADFIASIDQEFIKPLLDNFKEPLKIVVCGDHVTSSVTGKHTNGKLPVVASQTFGGSVETIKSYLDIEKFLMRASE